MTHSDPNDKIMQLREPAYSWREPAALGSGEQPPPPWAVFDAHGNLLSGHDSRAEAEQAKHDDVQ